MAPICLLIRGGFILPSILVKPSFFYWKTIRKGFQYEEGWEYNSHLKMSQTWTSGGQKTLLHYSDLGSSFSFWRILLCQLISHYEPKCNLNQQCMCFCPDTGNCTLLALSSSSSVGQVHAPALVTRLGETAHQDEWRVFLKCQGQASVWATPSISQEDGTCRALATTGNVYSRCYLANMI